MDWKHSPHLLPEKTFMLILWLGSCSNAHAMHPRGMVCGKSKPSCLRKFPLCKLLWRGQGGMAEMHSPHLPQRGFSVWKRRGSPRFFLCVCLPGGSWHSFPSLYLSFSIYDKLIQLLLLLKWHLSSPGRLFRGAGDVLSLTQPFTLTSVHFHQPNWEWVERLTQLQAFMNETTHISESCAN